MLAGMGKTGIWLRDGFVLAAVLALHGAAFLILGNARQVGAIESEVASISMNLEVTPVIEERIQGDVEGAPDPLAAQEPPPLVRQAAAKDDPPREEQTVSSQPEVETPPQPEPQSEPEVKSEEPKPQPEPEVKSKEPKPQPEPEVKPEEPKPQPEPEVKPEPKPESKPEPKSEPKPKVKPEEPKPKPEAKPQPERLPRKVQAKKPRHRKARKRAGYRAKVDAPGRVVRGSTRGSMRGPRQSSTGARVSLRRVRQYGSLVRARIVRHRPRGSGRNCRVVVRFALSTTGRLRFARVASSSCDAQLTRAALAAVRRAAPFPRPPAGMPPARLSFSLPFRFR